MAQQDVIWGLNNCIRHPDRKQVVRSLAGSSPEPQPLLGSTEVILQPERDLRSHGTLFLGNLSV